MRRFLANYSADRHLQAYLLHRDPRHLANAWTEFRKAGVEPDAAMLHVVDQLAADVLSPPRIPGRPMANPVRDAELVRLVRSLKKSPHKVGAYRAVARDSGMTTDALKAIVKRVKRAEK